MSGVKGRSGAPGVPKSESHKDAIRASMRAFWESSEGQALREATRRRPGRSYETAYRAARAALEGEPCVMASDECSGALEAAFRHDTPKMRRAVDDLSRPFSFDVRDYQSMCQWHHAAYDAEHRQEQAARLARNRSRAAERRRERRRRGGQGSSTEA